MNFRIEQLRWGVRRRLEFIEFRLFWDGKFNRRDLTDTFGISAQQASADIALYDQIVPNSFVYNSNKKVYFCIERFKPAFLTESIDSYLLQKLAVEHQWIRLEDSWIGNSPPVEVASLSRATTDASILLQILRAIHGRLEIDINYTSLTGSSNPSRTIAPHALTHGDGQWYVRSWSSNHNDFRDYSLNRINKIFGSRSATIDRSLDFEWVHVINLVIVPHPKLSKKGKASVARSFKMTNGRLDHPCRLSVSFYLISHHNLDLDPDKLDPDRQQIILLNRDEVKNARSATRQMSKEALARTLTKRPLDSG